jgi:hypothetical protein
MTRCGLTERRFAAGLLRPPNNMKELIRTLSAVLALGSALLGIPCRAQETNILAMCSPKFRQFVTAHPEASQLLTNVVSEAFAGRAIQVFYIYTPEDGSVPRAGHFYPAESTVAIRLRENQQPVDEFVSLVYEALNSESEEQFGDLFQKAQSGGISRTNFARQMLNVEFKALTRTRVLFKGIKLSEKEISESYYCKRFKECPDGFEDYLAYLIKASPPKHGTIHDYYEAMYDSLRNP